jgi:predicted glycogen debranching enzyme
VIAGYPWFSDWGRDSMIALPGLCLTTGRFDEAKGILRAFAQNVSEGMLPNRFPDSPAEAPEYNTVDATLWYFVAAWDYFEARGDAAFVRDELMPVLAEILAWHERGTRHGIRVGSDGLLHAGEPGVQLTWMDAKVEDWVVTPRIGKPVEIQALWANALAISAELEERFGRADEAGKLRARAEQVRKTLVERFWNEETGLFDVVGGPDGDGRDGSIRPNQIFALSLPFPLLDGDRAERLLALVESKLLTPRGLRTLSADDPAYRPIYTGGPLERDGAYHQGTVWPWLLGPYVTALVRVRGEEGKRQGRKILEAFAPHLDEAGIGTVSEIFDAEPPHAPRGCPAQAWSVAELLRAAIEVAS